MSVGAIKRSDRDQAPGRRHDRFAEPPALRRPPRGSRSLAALCRAIDRRRRCSAHRTIRPFSAGSPRHTWTTWRSSRKSDLKFGRLVMLGGNGGSVTVRANGLPTYREPGRRSNPTPQPGSVRDSRSGQSLGPGTADVSRSAEATASNGTARLDTLSVTADFTTGFQQDGSLVRLKLDSSGINRIVVGGKLTLTGPYPGQRPTSCSR